MEGKPAVRRLGWLAPLVLAGAITAGVYAWSRSLVPDYTTSLFGQSAADTFPVKSWLATIALALALAQLYTALWIFGKVNRKRPRPRHLGAVHRLTGAAAILVTLPIAYHCLFAYGFRALDARTVVHSLAGCFIYGAFAAKVLIVRSKRLPGWLLPLAGGTMVTVIVVLWYSSALWYFNGRSVPLLASGGGGARTGALPTYGTPQAAAVRMKDIQFSPRQLTAKVGQTVTWTNDDPVDHNVVATNGASFKSSNFGMGGTYRFRLAAPGKIAYVCTLHPGMSATITVTR